MTLTAAVQQDATDELPTPVTADVRPVCAGIRRGLQGFRTPPEEADLIHGLDVDIPLRSRRAATIATVHDAAVVDVPWAFSANRARAERLLLLKTVRSADALVVPSSFTAERIQSLYGRCPYVTPLAAAYWAGMPADADVERVRSHYRLPPQFVLQVGSAEPRKLTALLIQAGRLAGIPVVLAGLGSATLTGPGVLGLGHIPAADLPPLYRAATIVSYLSMYEGFGLPPLEAMACGAAVMASTIRPLTDVLGNAARYVANREDVVSSALIDLVNDPPQITALRELAAVRVAEFSWDKTARGTADVYGLLL